MNNYLTTQTFDNRKHDEEKPSAPNPGANIHTAVKFFSLRKIERSVTFLKN